VRTLLGEMDIAGALVTADAAHTCADTARYLAGDCHADYLLTIKGNRASLHTAAITTGRDLVAAEPGHIAEERGHGRINRWTTWTTHTDPTAWARIDLPHATRLAVVRRDIADLAGQPLSKEIVFVATSRAGHMPHPPWCGRPQAAPTAPCSAAKPRQALGCRRGWRRGSSRRFVPPDRDCRQERHVAPQATTYIGLIRMPTIGPCTVPIGSLRSRRVRDLRATG
jgi:hypothetical protein